MKANLTRGNSITENHKPFETVEDCFIIAFALMQEYIEARRKTVSNRLDRFPSGAAVVKERGPEVISSGHCKEIMKPFSVSVLPKGFETLSLENVKKN